MNDINIEAVVSAVINQIKNDTPVKMTLDAAKRIAKRVEDKAAEMGVKAVVAITNSGARPVLVESMDDAYIASYDIALNKAYTSTSLKMSTAQLKKLSQPGEPLYGIQFTNSSKIVIFGGGEPVMDGDNLVGGIGVSGGTEEEDTFLGEFAAKVAWEELKCRKNLK